MIGDGRDGDPFAVLFSVDGGGGLCDARLFRLLHLKYQAETDGMCRSGAVGT